MHPTGKERFQLVQPPQWTGDLPSADPTDWFESTEEYYDEFVGVVPDNDNDELLENEWLIDEY